MPALLSTSNKNGALRAPLICRCKGVVSLTALLFTQGFFSFFRLPNIVRHFNLFYHFSVAIAV